MVTCRVVHIGVNNTGTLESFVPPQTLVRLCIWMVCNYVPWGVTDYPFCRSLDATLEDLKSDMHLDIWERGLPKKSLSTTAQKKVQDIMDQLRDERSTGGTSTLSPARPGPWKRPSWASRHACGPKVRFIPSAWGASSQPWRTCGHKAYSRQTLPMLRQSMIWLTRKR